jgi:hypothetical protein
MTTKNVSNFNMIYYMLYVWRRQNFNMRRHFLGGWGGGQLDLGLKRIYAWKNNFVVCRHTTKFLFAMRFQKGARQSFCLSCVGVWQIF